MSVKSTQMMIGDWMMVGHPSRKLSPFQITAGLLYRLQDMENGNTTKDSPLYRIVEQIGLTTEILEKNGWTYNDENEQFHPKTWSGNGIMLKQEDEGFRIVVTSEYDDEDTNGTPFVLRYVSDLQHALKLRGKDKEIVL